jgi:hypothetical protein
MTGLERVLRMYVYDHGVKGASQQEMDPISDYMEYTKTWSLRIL